VASGKPAPGPAAWAASTAWFPTVSPDRKRLAGVDQTLEVRIYGRDGPPITCAGGRTGEAPARPAFSPDGSLLALPVTGEVRVWNAASGERVQTLQVGKGQVTAAVFSPDGRLLAAGGAQPGVRLWDTRTWEARQPLSVPSVFALAFSPDGEWLAVSAGTGLVQLLDVKTGAELGALRGSEQGGARALAFSPDGQRLAVGAADHTVRVWDLRRLAPASADAGARLLAAPDGGFTRAAVLTGDTRLCVLDTASGAELLRVRGIKDYYESIALSPDGTRLAFAPRDGLFGRDAVVVRSVPDNRSLGTVWTPAYVEKIEFSPDGAEVSVISPTEGPKRGIQRGELVNARQTVWEDSGDYWGAASLAYSPDGLSFVAGFGDGKIRVWDRKTGRLEATLLGHSDRVNCLCFSADSRSLVSGGRADRSVILWDVPGRRQLLRRSGHEGGVRQVALSPDGQLIASCGGNGDLNLFDAVNGQLVLTLEGPRDVARLAFSRDGGRLLGMTSAGDLVQWDGTPAPLRRTLRGHDNKIQETAFSPDGRVLASFAFQLKWWDVATGRDLFHSDRYVGTFVTALAFRPDGRQLGLTTVGKKFEVWDVAEKKKLADFEAKEVLWRLALSPEEGVLATWDNGRGLAVWQFPAVRQRFRVSVAAAGLPDIAFSADGRLVTVTDALGRRTGFDAATGRPVVVPPDFRPAAPPASPASPDGRLFALPDSDLIHLVALHPDAAELERRRAATRLDVRWQERQAARHEAAKNWFAATVHLDAIIREHPEESLKARRAKAAEALAEMDRK
jgi:WD40 repeat protein